MAKEETPRTFLGDGVYVEHDGFHIRLITSDGFSDTNTIFLDPDVWQALKEWADRRSL